VLALNSIIEGKLLLSMVHGLKFPPKESLE
jgi:hypothetical protein